MPKIMMLLINGMLKKRLSLMHRKNEYLERLCAKIPDSCYTMMQLYMPMWNSGGAWWGWFLQRFVRRFFRHTFHFMWGLYENCSYICASHIYTLVLRQSIQTGLMFCYLRWCTYRHLYFGRHSNEFDICSQLLTIFVLMHIWRSMLQQGWCLLPAILSCKTYICACAGIYMSRCQLLPIVCAKAHAEIYF